MMMLPFIYCKECKIISRHDKWEIGAIWPDPICEQCNAKNVIRWSPLVAPWVSYFVRDRCQRIYGNPEQLFRLCIAIGKNPNSITTDLAHRYSIDIGPRHILAYNKLVGIESLT